MSFTTLSFNNAKEVATFAEQTSLTLLPNRGNGIFFRPMLNVAFQILQDAKNQFIVSGDSEVVAKLGADANTELTPEERGKIRSSFVLHTVFGYFEPSMLLVPIFDADGNPHYHEGTFVDELRKKILELAPSGKPLCEVGTQIREAFKDTQIVCDHQTTLTFVSKETGKNYYRAVLTLNIKKDK